QAAHPRQAHDDEDRAGDHGADDEAVVAELRHDAVDDDHERAGRSADLHAAAAEGGDQEAGDDGGVETALGWNSGGDGEGERQRKRDDADDDAGDQVTEQSFARIPLAQTDDRFRDEHRTRTGLYRTSI